MKFKIPRYHDRSNYKTRSAFERFWEKVDLNDYCWEWIGYKRRDGYGWFEFNYKPVKAHRFSWEFFNGEIPKNLCVLHRCDNRSCVNPAHLWLGTKAQNNTDRKIKGRNRVIT